MFSGQGSQYYQMGKQLFENNTMFRDWMLYLDGLNRKLSGNGVIDTIYSRQKSEVFDNTSVTHPAIFMIEYSLSKCLMQMGTTPDMTLGASLGSFAAAAIAGYIKVEDALAAVVEQAAAFEASCECGGMIAILESPSLYDEDFLREHSVMAAINFDKHFCISGKQADLERIEATLKQKAITHQRLPVSFAYHSPWIENSRKQFEEFVKKVPIEEGHLPIACCGYSTVFTNLNTHFFWDAVRQPIRFMDTITHMELRGPYRYIDVGPSGTMATFTNYVLSESSHSTAHSIMTPFGREEKNLEALIGGEYV